jgi:hypothetical protein
VTIESINVQATRMNPDFTFNFYQQIVTPVPEPSMLAFCAIAGAAVFGWTWWRRSGAK